MTHGLLYPPQSVTGLSAMGYNTFSYSLHWPMAIIRVNIDKAYYPTHRQLVLELIDQDT